MRWSFAYAVIVGGRVVGAPVGAVSRLHLTSGVEKVAVRVERGARFRCAPEREAFAGRR